MDCDGVQQQATDRNISHYSRDSLSRDSLAIMDCGGVQQQASDRNTIADQDPATALQWDVPRVVTRVRDADTSQAPGPRTIADQDPAGQGPAQTTLPRNDVQRLPKHLRFACVNARSVRNKIAVIVDHMVNSCIDVCAITETWLKECDSVSIARLSTAGFVFRSFPRQSDRNGGGTGILCRESLDVKLSDCKEIRSFEFSEWNVQVHKRTIKVVIIYRPPYSDDHSVSSHVFFDEFSSYLENIVMAPEVLLITGDFNFHIDCPSNADAKKFADLLDTFGLIQHVHVPTHSSGHTLDLVITRSTNDVTIISPLTTFALSDHSFVECLLDIPRPNISVSEVHYRKLKQIDLEVFKADISVSELCNATWSSVDEMAKCYDDTLRSILDKHAPLKTKVMAVRPIIPWFNDNL